MMIDVNQARGENKPIPLIKQTGPKTTPLPNLDSAYYLAHYKPNNLRNGPGLLNSSSGLFVPGPVGTCN